MRSYNNWNRNFPIHFFLCVQCVVIVLILLFTGNAWATPYTHASWDGGQYVYVKYDHNELDANNESHSVYSYIISGDVQGNVEAHLQPSGLEMTLYSKDVTTTNLWVKSISQASDEFMISYPGQYVDALLNFRLDGELSVASSVPVDSYARNTLSVRLSIYNIANGDTLYQSEKGISLIYSNSVPMVQDGFRELYDNFGVPVNFAGGYYWATFVDVPLNFSLYGLPTNTPLEYELRLMNDIIRNGLADFDNTLRFDAVKPIVLEGADGIYTLTSTFFPLILWHMKLPAAYFGDLLHLFLQYRRPCHDPLKPV